MSASLLWVRWKAVSKQSICGMSSRQRVIARMQSMLLGWWSGASGTRRSISARIVTSRSTGALNFGPPWTMRWPTAATLPGAKCWRSHSPATGIASSKLRTDGGGRVAALGGRAAHFCCHPRRASEALDLPLGELVGIRRIGGRGEDGELEARGAGIDDEDQVSGAHGFAAARGAGGILSTRRRSASKCYRSVAFMLTSIAAWELR